MDHKKLYMWDYSKPTLIYSNDVFGSGCIKKYKNMWKNVVNDKETKTKSVWDHGCSTPHTTQTRNHKK